jgi:hypothetical protein
MATNEYGFLFSVVPSTLMASPNKDDLLQRLTLGSPTNLNVLIVKVRIINVACVTAAHSGRKRVLANGLPLWHNCSERLHLNESLTEVNYG